MKVETYKCDVCGKVKGEVNHWFVARTSNTRLGPLFTIVGWSSKAITNPMPDGCKEVKELHLCGQACAITAMSEFLSK